MTAESTPRLQLPFIMAAQAQKHVTHNESLRTLDALVQLAVKDKDLAAPPEMPAEGDAYIVAAEASGAWEGRAGAVTAFQDGAWAILEPREGWLAWVGDEAVLYVYDGEAWGVATEAGATVNPVPLVGVNTTADTTNRLAVASEASLFTHVGDDHRQTINKATSTDTASTVYQSGYSGRAEVGLAGDDDFRFKVSPDGSTWRTALTLVGAVGVPRLPVFTLATLPAAADSGAGAIVCISDLESGPVLVLSDGTDWYAHAGSSSLSVATPEFSPTAGTYTSVQSIAITCATSGATIRYTSDGSPPDEESPVYSDLVSVAVSQTLKAIAFREGLAPSAIATASYAIELPPVPLIVIAGESNAIGLGSNLLASGGELAEHADVLILNNATLDLEPLEIGVNNQIPDGETVDDETHGLELGLANTFEAGRWPYEMLAVVKAGRNGSTSAEWQSSDESGYWSDLVARVEAATDALAALGKQPLPLVVWSLGLNEIGGDAAASKSGTQTVFANLRSLLGATTPIAITHFSFPLTEDGAWWDDIIDEIAGDDAGVIPIATLDAGGGDASAVIGTPGEATHWGYAGLLDIAERIVDAVEGGAGTLDAPELSLEAGDYTGDQELLISGPDGATIRYTIDGSQPSSHSPVYASPITLASDTTVRAVAMRGGWKNSPEASAEYVISTGFVTWTAFGGGASQVGDYLVCSGTPQGARATDAIDATQPFTVVYHHEGEDTYGMVLYLDDDTDTVYDASTSPGVGSDYPCGGVFCYWEHIYSVVAPGATQTYVGTSFTTPPGTGLVRLRKSGDDVVIEKSEDDGATWSSPLHTFSGVLAGKSTLYLKALNSTGAKQIRARIET